LRAQSPAQRPHFERDSSHIQAQAAPHTVGSRGGGLAWLGLISYVVFRTQSDWMVTRSTLVVGVGVASITLHRLLRLLIHASWGSWSSCIATCTWRHLTIAVLRHHWLLVTICMLMLTGVRALMVSTRTWACRQLILYKNRVSSAHTLRCDWTSGATAVLRIVWSSLVTAARSCRGREDGRSSSAKIRSARRVETRC
jgi:hypothetical protein